MTVQWLFVVIQSQFVTIQLLFNTHMPQGITIQSRFVTIQSPSGDMQSPSHHYSITIRSHKPTNTNSNVNLAFHAQLWKECPPHSPIQLSNDSWQFINKKQSLAIMRLINFKRFGDLALSNSNPAFFPVRHRCESGSSSSVRSMFAVLTGWRHCLALGRRTLIFGWCRRSEYIG